MCGIAGIINYKDGISDVSSIENMLSVISYRGPDQSGIYHSQVAAIGNVRLSIIDIFGGQQPVSDPTGRYWIVLNGEIFNFKELREELQKTGCIFFTNSDTEVLVQLYAKEGKGSLSKLNGQFSFAIWDKVNEELFIARDRIGICPLFYNLSENIFSFASEIKALLRNPWITPEFSFEGLIQIYTFWANIPPQTVFNGIYELLPGQYLVYNRKGIKKEKYWELNFSKNENYYSLSDSLEKFDEIFVDAVRIRLRANVEVAAYLSGGIDSTATVAYMKSIEPGILNTFSVNFEEKEFDEKYFQSLAAFALDTKHRSIVCSSSEIANNFPKAIWHCETPVPRTAPVPMLLLSKFVHENKIKVVIAGEGSDEMLAGYDLFKEVIIRRFWSTQPESKFRPLLLRKLYPYLPQMQNVNLTALKMFYGYRLKDINDPFYSHLLRWNNSNHITKHLSPAYKNVLNNFHSIDSLHNKLPLDFGSWDPLSKAQWLETTIFMSGYLLSSQGDRMIMANSVEGRYPFLDHRLIEFCTSLPSRFKLKGLDEKYLLKKLLQNKIPDEIIKRPKQAYRAPIRSPFMSESSPAYVMELTSERFTKSSGVFDFESLKSIYARISKTGFTSEVDNMLLSFVISTHLLHYQFIEKYNEYCHPGELNNLKLINDL
jgi:asparagine synthase (glutamine-hydrolysing)